MDVANRALKLLIDTGSEITIVASDVIDNAEEIETTTVALTGLSGNKQTIPTEGTVKAKIFVNDVVLNEKIYIIQRENTYLQSEEFDGFLGRDFLKKHGATIDLHNDTIQLRVAPVYDLRNSRTTSSQDSVPRPGIEFKTCNTITCSKCDDRVEKMRTKRLFRGMRIHKVNNDRGTERQVQIVIRPQQNQSRNDYIGEALTQSRNDNGEAQTNSRNERKYKNEYELRAQNQLRRKNDSIARNPVPERNMKTKEENEIEQNEVNTGDTFLAELFNNENEIEQNNIEPIQNEGDYDEEIERLLNLEKSNVKINDDAREFLRCFMTTAADSASNDNQSRHFNFKE